MDFRSTNAKALAVSIASIRLAGIVSVAEHMFLFKLVIIKK